MNADTPALPPPDLVEQAGILLACFVMTNMRAELSTELARLEAVHGADVQRIAAAFALDFLAQHKPLKPARVMAILQGPRP